MAEAEFDPVRRLIGFEPHQLKDPEWRHKERERTAEARYAREERSRIRAEERERTDPLPDPYELANARTPLTASQAERRQILREAVEEVAAKRARRTLDDVYGKEAATEEDKRLRAIEERKRRIDPSYEPRQHEFAVGRQGGFSDAPLDQGGNPIEHAPPRTYEDPATIREVGTEQDPALFEVPSLPAPDSPLRADAGILDVLELARATGLPVPTTREQELTAMALNLDTDQVRPDGTIQGPGWKGALTAPDGYEVTEMPVELAIPGGDIVLGPLIVPETTPEEIELILRGTIPDEAVTKAEDFAYKRIKQGKSPFKESKDERHPGFKPGRRDWERGGRRGY